MALNPQLIREARFKQAKRGYDPAEVDSFLEDAAAALEAAQNEATAMEARARAAVARLQELAQPASDAPRATADDSETISRTLLLAQRTADAAIADAQAEAERVLTAAGEDANGLLEEARLEARRVGESERVQVEGEVQALLARRDFLESDVDHLEQYLVAQRERITEVVSDLTELVQRVPSGLGDMRRPLLSAAAEEAGEAGEPAAGDEADQSELAEIIRVVEVGDVHADTGGEAGPEPAAAGAPDGRDDAGTTSEP